MALASDDLNQIHRHGLSEEEVRRQLDCFRQPPGPIRLDRPCRPGDGIVQLSDDAAAPLETAYQAAASAGRFGKFVPASGAASRMFQDLSRALAQEADGLEAARHWHERLPDFPFADQLTHAAESRNAESRNAAAVQDTDLSQPLHLIETLLAEDGLNYRQTAKALIPFHSYGHQARTPLEEHLVEAAQHLADRDGICRVHFTIPQHQEMLFRDHLREITGRLEAEYGGSFEIGCSIQRPETDTIAADLEGQPFRDDQARLVFRPGGHGALLRNLGSMDGDLVFVRNIDNVQPEWRQQEILRWNRLLGGYVVILEERIHGMLNRLNDGGALPPADWLESSIHWSAKHLSAPWLLDGLTQPSQEQARQLQDLLDRPLRVCGMVQNLGEPGGGPFWVGDANGQVTPQIVEASQIDMQQPDQQQIARAATHFNPVHLVCRLRNHQGEAFDLDRFIDPATIFISQKNWHGRPLEALEHPGLWNGAMARWNTLFVEVPAAIFAPVKTVFDLLRPEHQPKP